MVLWVRFIVERDNVSVLEIVEMFVEETNGISHRLSCALMERLLQKGTQRSQISPLQAFDMILQQLTTKRHEHWPVPAKS